MINQGEQTAWDPWSFRQSVELSAGDVDLVGFKVEAIDGGVGKIVEAVYDAASSYVVVDTGPWIFGSKVVLPAGTIVRIDPTDRKVQVERTKEEIKNAPGFDEDAYTTWDYRERLGDYYRGFAY